MASPPQLAAAIDVPYYESIMRAEFARPGEETERIA
jgi:hypothetical protein